MWIIDFEGQKLSERLYQYILNIAGVLALFAAIYTKSVYSFYYTMLGGLAVAFMVCLPPWPFFNRSPVKWLPTTGEDKKSN